MYITMEAAPQSQHEVDLNDPSKAVAHAVREFESRGEFSTRARRAWSGHPAAPMLVVAGRNRVSTDGPGKKVHAHTGFVIMGGAEGAASIGRKG